MKCSYSAVCGSGVMLVLMAVVSACKLACTHDTHRALTPHHHYHYHHHHHHHNNNSAGELQQRSEALQFLTTG
jgi:hypothetical protein